MENTHDKDAITCSGVEDAVPQAIVLKERAASPYDGPSQRRRFGDPLQALFESKIVALGSLQTEVSIE